jgi:hypothetical protein
VPLRYDQSCALESLAKSAGIAKVRCPYCVVGAATVSFDIEAGEHIDLQRALGTPHKCDTCPRWFRLKAHVRLEGVTMEGLQSAVKFA